MRRNAILLTALLGGNVVAADTPFSLHAGVYHGESDESGSYNGFSVGGGYELCDGFAVQGSYYDEGSNSYTSNGVTVTDNGSGWAAGGVISYPVIGGGSLGGRGGVIFWENERETLAQGGGVVVTDTDGSEPYYGVEAELGLNESIGIRVDYTRYVIDADNSANDIDVLGGGVVYHF
mgnify:FL=1